MACFTLHCLVQLGCSYSAMKAQLMKLSVHRCRANLKTSWSLQLCSEWLCTLCIRWPALWFHVDSWYDITVPHSGASHSCSLYHAVWSFLDVYMTLKDTQHCWNPSSNKSDCVTQGAKTDAVTRVERKMPYMHTRGQRGSSGKGGTGEKKLGNEQWRKKTSDK